MINGSLKIVFMGTPDFALPSLEALCAKYDVRGVFCQPDKINGRGNTVTFGAVKQFALDHGIAVFQPQTFKDGCCEELLASLEPELIAVAAYGKLLPEYVLNLPKYGCINVHGSLLPKYRGASPVQAAVLNGDAKAGVTIMKMAKGLDTGDIISQTSVDVGEYETAGELFDRLSLAGARLLADTVDDIVTGKARYTPQIEQDSSHVSMITKQMGELDFNMSAFELKCRIYGLNPWPSAYINAQSGMIKLHRAVMGKPADEKPGTIVSVGKSGIEVACGDNNCLVITQMQRLGKKKMDAYSFSLGVKIKTGMSIYSL